MERGQSGIFQDRAIHSIAYPAGARFIRVTGTNLENIRARPLQQRGRHDGGRETSQLSRRRLTVKPNPHLKTPGQILGVCV